MVSEATRFAMKTAALRVIACIACIACGALAGCTLITDSFRQNDFSGDPFPIYIGRESGAVMIGAHEPDGPPLPAVLDVLSPVTLTDPGIHKLQALVTSDLTLLGRSSRTDPEFDVPRARLRSAEVISLHPCAESEEEPVCSVGRPGMQQPYGAIVGANVLAGDALRLRLGDAEVFVLADVGGDERDRTFACDAVFSSPYRGGGTLLIAGTEVPFGGRRVTLQTCLGADPDPAPIVTGSPPVAEALPQTARGGDALLVMSTGIGITLISEPAYERYRQASLLQAKLLRRSAPPTEPPPLDELPDASAFLPSGQVFGRRALLDRLTLTAAASSSSRAPCRQAYAHHLLLEGDCSPDEPDCPCTSGSFCSVPAVVELVPPGGFEVLVVPDGDATLQALRAELRPDQPEVDGILGADMLRFAEIDVDYPHDRVLMRCTAPASECQTRPALAAAADRTQVGQCIGRVP
jgi:hypothetical protein